MRFRLFDKSRESAVRYDRFACVFVKPFCDLFGGLYHIKIARQRMCETSAESIPCARAGGRGGLFDLHAAAALEDKRHHGIFMPACVFKVREYEVGGAEAQTVLLCKAFGKRIKRTAYQRIVISEYFSSVGVRSI